MQSAIGPGESFELAVTDEFEECPSTYLEKNYAIYRGLPSHGQEAMETKLYSHPNGVAIVALASEHPLFCGSSMDAAQSQAAEEKAPKPEGKPRLSFQTESGNLLDASFRKGRGPFIPAGYPLAVLHTTCDSAGMSIRSPANGSLLEANRKLEDLTGDELLRLVKCA